jgi:isoquinoline 1-oxidoreductase beta subunit
MGHQDRLSRRSFVVSSFAGGMAIAISRPANALAPDGKPWEGPQASEFSAWLAVGADDVVTVRSTKPEIGNGALTQSAVIVSEELPVDWSKIRVEYAATARDYRENNVYSQKDWVRYFSGRSTKENVIDIYLQVGASARERLKTAAAQRWKVPVSEVEAKDSTLVHKASGRTLRYGEVAADAAKVKFAAEPAVKPHSEWTILGKESRGKLNNPMIVSGTATYGIDVRPAGMVYAALKQSPVHGGKLKSYDANAVKNLPGVLAVVTVDPSEARGLPPGKGASPMGFKNTEVQSGVAVIAEHYWQARKALDALPVEWDDGPGAQWKNIAQIEAAALAACDKDSEKPAVSRGDISILSKQPKVVEASYVTPYAEQSCMEPLNGTAMLKDGKLEIWHPSQHPQQAFWVAADEASLSPENVTMHQTYVGGGFGRRVYGNDVRMVVAVAKKFPGRPVQVVWSREETMRQGRYRALYATKFKAGLGADGLPQAMTARTASGPGTFVRGLPDSPYFINAVPNTRVDINTIPVHILTGPYRGPGYHSFTFMVESFVDECAHAAGVDPVEYRLKLLANWKDPGWAKTLKEVAKQSNWGKPLPKGMAQGVAIGNWGNEDGKPETGTTTAVVATVEVTAKNAIKVHTLDVAFDTGTILNHDAVLTEFVGGAIFGYNMAMNEGLTVKDGRIVEGNFSEYHIVRTGEVPKVNVHFGGLTGHPRFAEVGEPPVGPVGPAIGNAIYKATGVRLRSMPFRQQLGVTWA